MIPPLSRLSRLSLAVITARIRLPKPGLEQDHFTVRAVSDRRNNPIGWERRIGPVAFGDGSLETDRSRRTDGQPIPLEWRPGAHR
jgi:hypothetical protein